MSIKEGTCSKKSPDGVDFAVKEMVNDMAVLESQMQPPETIESPGKYLKAKRESDRISLRGVAIVTRIREPVLRAIEEDRYDDLPHLYVKSFLSTYAKCLGLDPTDVIMLHQKHAGKLSFPRSQESKHPSTFGRKRVNVRLLVISISAALLVAVIVYASFKLLR
jgi:cytoskeletal protein RodZ